jgi:phosphatidylinositol alpha-1,6-mannosyltransferase
VTVLSAQDYVDIPDVEEFDMAQPFSIVRFETQGAFLRQAVSRLFAASRLATYLDPDLVVASGSWAVSLSALAPGVRRRTCVSIGHGMEFGRASGIDHVVRKYAYRRSSAVVCVSGYTERRMHDAGIHPGHVVVIPNGGDSRAFTPGVSAKDRLLNGRLAGKPLLLTVGNIGERKAQDVIVDALPALVEQGLDVHYLAIGLPTRARELMQRAERIGVSDRVHVVGVWPLDELVTAYQSCDVFAMTSREASDGDFEGYGIAVIEAALCGKPAVVTAESGLEEAVVDGETGLVVPQNDPAAFASAAGQLLRHQSLRETLGENARQRALATATWELRADRYLALFDQIAKR